MNKTLGLAMITNDVDATLRFLENYGKYFDQVFITLADKTKANLLDLTARAAKTHPNTSISYFKWCDHFGKARIFNQERITTDYWFWADSDDEIDNAENIPAVFQHAVVNDLDAVYLNYDYYRNELGESQANHWRERLIKTAGVYKWTNVPCHETVIATAAKIDRSNLVSVRHKKTVGGMEESMARNKVMLEKDWGIQKDPRTAFYLGLTYEYEKNYEKSLEMFTYMVENGGWDEQKVVAWNHIADCYQFLGKTDKALDATDYAIRLDPSHPDAYYQKILLHASLNQMDKASEWVEIALQKKPKETTMQLVDPTKYTYRGLYIGAQVYLSLGNVERAFQLYEQIMKTAPYFIDQMNKETNQNWNYNFQEAYFDHKAVEYIKYLLWYYQSRSGKLTELYRSLPKKLVNDPRLTSERLAIFPPITWPPKSIAIFCGITMEAWGADTLEGGMGGSEEAIVYLSREFEKLGYSVTVFCERDTAYNDGAITYLPWTEFNAYDTFDTLIVWRQPMNARGVKANKRIVDLHDVIPQELVEQTKDEVYKFMVKSAFHRSLYPNVPDDKFVIVGNGIRKEQFA